MREFPFLTPRPLASLDAVAAFDCGVEALNSYLQRNAFQAQGAGSARTYVALETGASQQIAGFYTLVFGSVEHAAAPARVTKGLGRHPVPVVILARLAVDKRFAGLGLGTELLRDAMLRTLAAAEIAGLRAVVVEAKNEEVKRFYEKFGFEALPESPLRLFLILKDVRALVRR